jgi:hypothetical protein
MAIVTNRIKKQVISDIVTDFSNSGNNYFAAIGRSEDWNDSDIAPTITNTQKQDRDFRLSVQSVKKIIDQSFVVPRYNWSSGAVYSAYDDNQVGYPTQSYYVMNDNNQVYICLQQSKSASGVSQVSTVQPSGNTTGTPFETADGYVWKFLYSIGALDANKFISANFIPVQFITSTDSDSPASDIEQEIVQNNAIIGQVVGYVIDSGGAGYSATPTITISGNGTAAKAAASISGGQVVKVEVIDSSGTLTFGSGYDYAKVNLTGGGSPTKPAAIRPILSTPLGIGGDPRDDLRSTSVMFNAKPEGTEAGDFIVGNDFRQVGLIKNMELPDSDAKFTESTGIALKKLVLSSVTTGFTADNTIEGGTSGVKALIDRVDSSNIWYHQTEATSFGNFDSGESISEIDGSGAGTLNASFAPYVDPEVDTFSGEVLYIDNRASVTRSPEQTEDIKIVIQI